MAVEDVTCGNENEARDSVATITIPSRKMESVEERNLYADRNGNKNALRDENEIGDSVTQCNIPCHKVEETYLYSDKIDKNVTQSELPELMVYYEEKDYHVVKDICIDEGVPFKDKNQNGDVTKEREDRELLSSKGSKSSSENNYNEDDIQDWGIREEVVDMESLLADALKSLLENHLVDDIVNDGGSLTLVQTGHEEKYTTTDNIVDNVPRGRAKSLKSILESHYSDQIPCSESECKAVPSLVSTSEDSNKSSPADDLSYSSKAECATIISGFDSSKSTASNRDEHVASLKTDSELVNHENAISDISAVGSEIQKGQGESSFSMAGPASGLITYSGRMTWSGNVSLRSDSSTTSTRSFAFPIIQAEWNSSPIRMAKADRRHRGWRQGLLCCRF